MVLRSRIRKWIFGRCPLVGGSFRYYGTKVYFPKKSLVFNMACDQGVYEHDNIKTLISLIRPNTTYFDVGANIGLLSVPILHQEPTCTVVSLEPSPNAAPFLRRTIQNSKYGDRWILVEKAASDTVGETTFLISSPDLGAFDGIKNTQRAKIITSITVPMTTLDYEWEVLRRPKVSVIKVDVEGAEADVISGALSLIEHEKPCMVIEWNAANLAGNGYETEIILKIADRLKYALFSLPHRVRIRDLTDLIVQMSYTENFLLTPEVLWV